MFSEMFHTQQWVAEEGVKMADYNRYEKEEKGQGWSRNKEEWDGSTPFN
jgi:hypothetical protein